MLTVIACCILLTGIWIGKHMPGHDPSKDETITYQEDEFKDLFPEYTVRGGRPKPSDKYRYQVAQRIFGFRFIVTGNACTDVRDLDSLEVANNKRTDSILTKRIGKNWYEKFENTVDSLYCLDTLAVSIAKNDGNVKKRIGIKSGKNPEKYPAFICYATPQDNLKMISVIWVGKIYNAPRDVSFMRVLVDLKKKKVHNIDDMEMEWSRYW